MRNRSEQTICAISTPPGTGGIAVIRLSGPGALQLAQKISPGLLKKTIQSHRAYFSMIRDSSGEQIGRAHV